MLGFGVWVLGARLRVQDLGFGILRVGFRVVYIYIYVYTVLS